jgi:hypothetical protein
VAQEECIALALRELRHSLASDHAVGKQRFVTNRVCSDIVYAEAACVVRGVDHATGNPSFERALTAEARSTLDRSCEPVMQSIVRPIEITSPRERQPKERGTPSSVDLFDRNY